MRSAIAGSGQQAITVGFLGGLEVYFGNESNHEIPLSKIQEGSHSGDMRSLIKWLHEEFLSANTRNVFVLEDGTVRPGILVLINDADWDLEGAESYQLRDRDAVTFVSTLHGG